MYDKSINHYYYWKADKWLDNEWGKYRIKAFLRLLSLKKSKELII